MRQHLMMGLVGILLLGGCAWTAKQLGYYKKSVATPLAQGEQSPENRAREDASPLAAIPVWGGVLAMAASFLLGKIYTVQRGKALTTGQPVPASSAGTISKTLSNLSKAVFDIGPDGSAVKRSWKTVVAGLLAYALTLVPTLHTWAATNNTKFGAVLLSITALIMGLEKALSNTQVSSGNG